MPEFTNFDAGNTCWIDLATPDTAGAIAFYGSLFGWEKAPAENASAPEYEYMFRDGKAVAAIASKIMQSQPTAWSVYIAVDDIDACLTRVRAAGGEVRMEPTEVPNDRGTFATVTDTTGATFCLWSAKNMPGVQLANETNTWGYSEVRSSDIAATQSFYEAVFGWKAKSNEEFGIPGWSWYLGDKHLGGLADATDATSGWVSYFGVEDIDKAVEIATGNGGTVVEPPVETPIGPMGLVADPQGAQFGIARVAM